MIFKYNTKEKIFKKDDQLEHYKEFLKEPHNKI